MSSQADGFLGIKPSFSHHKETALNYRSATIEPQKFHKWTANNMYKSSYGHFHSKVQDSVNPKSTVIPGYGGYIPSIKAENIHARGYSAMAKQSLHQDKLATNPFGLSSTGFNLNRNVLIDQSKRASSSKYGKTQIQKAHPNWNGQWRSTTQDFFRNPKNLLNPTYRETDKNLQTHKADTKGSGYATNFSYLDGKGWNPDPILKGDNNRSEYRDRFNPTTSTFHRDVNATKARLMLKTEMNYKFN